MRRTALAVTTTALAAATLLAPTAYATPTPTPTPSPSLPRITQTVEPERSVGGPRLAQMNAVILDAPRGVPAPPDIPDVAWVIADADTGEVLAAKNPHAHLLPASTLKALLAVHLLPVLDPKATFRATAAEASAQGTRVGMVPGQSYTAGQLFHALIMSSGNDAAYGLAALNGGMDKTVAELGDLAAELGAHDTVIKDPSGLDAPGQHSSAYDLALFGRAAITNEEYVRIATTKTIDFPAVARASRSRSSYVIGNHNRLVWNYDGAIGVKNGYTKAAHRTFIGAATRGGRTYLVTEMYGTGSSWRPAASLLDWAFAHGDKVTAVGRLVDRGEVTEPPEPEPSTTSGSQPAEQPSAQVAAAVGTPDGAATPSLLPVAGLAGLLALVAVGRRSRGRARQHHGRHRA